jgi:hypothetical protein
VFEMDKTLKERVEAFELVALPGQPMCVHLGTANLISDLWKEVQQLEEQMKALKILLNQKEPPPKLKLPEFIEGDPVIVWDFGGRKFIRIVCSVAEDGRVECYHEGLFESKSPYLMPITWNNYKPLPNYDYGNRRVWGVEGQ